jgi:biotin--protein ligase
MEALNTQGRVEIVKYVTDGGKLLAVGDGVATACGGEGSLGFYKGGCTRESKDAKLKSRSTIIAEGKLFRLKKAGEEKTQLSCTVRSLMGQWYWRAASVELM